MPAIKLSKIIISKNFRIGFIVAIFLFLFAARLLVQSFAMSLGYVYFIVISLAGLWFGLKGGLVTSTLASAVFLFEITAFQDWPFRNLVAQGAYLRLLVFFLNGMIVGYVGETEDRFKEKLIDLAFHDELTGCINYRWTMYILEKEIERSGRYKNDMSLAIIDIDHFKQINDKYGHLAGDEILQAFAQVLKKSIRTIDTVGRYGGEEFVIIFPENNSQESLVAMERIRRNVASMHIPINRSHQKVCVPVAFSAGLSSFPLNGKNLEALLDMADKALYRAKRNGRNQIIVEKRRWSRAGSSAGLKVDILSCANKTSLGALKIKDISQRGMLASFEQDISGGEFVLKILFPKDGESPEFKGRLIHKRRQEGAFHAGFYFSEIPADIEEKLSRYIKE